MHRACNEGYDQSPIDCLTTLCVRLQNSEIGIGRFTRELRLVFRLACQQGSTSGYPRYEKEKKPALDRSKIQSTTNDSLYHAQTLPGNGPCRGHRCGRAYPADRVVSTETRSRGFGRLVADQLLQRHVLLGFPGAVRPIDRQQNVHLLWERHRLQPHGATLGEGFHLSQSYQIPGPRRFANDEPNGRDSGPPLRLGAAQPAPELPELLRPTRHQGPCTGLELFPQSGSESDQRRL